nr:MAG TPA: hypothetical protein [Caudoviricetes sp.]
MSSCPDIKRRSLFNINKIYICFQLQITLSNLQFLIFLN